MRDKLKEWDAPELALVAMEQASRGGAANNKAMKEEAESALVALGYKPAQAEKSIAAIVKAESPDSSEELIRLALRAMLP